MIDFLAEYAVAAYVAAVTVAGAVGIYLGWLA